MSHTHSCNLVHCVFSTKDRANFIPDPARLWLYVGGIAGQKNILLWAAGGTTNHLHLLISLPPTLQLAKASKWINELGWRFAWQEGYSAFSVSQSQRRRVIDYIDGQEQHDKKWSFEQEFLALLKKSEIAYDERYVFG